MLGIDLYKEVLLNGEKYNGKKYKDKDGTIYVVDAFFDGVCNIRNIVEEGKVVGVINKDAHDDKCLGIDRFMLTELEEVKQQIEMSWQECLVKYIENPNKYYMKAIDKNGGGYYFTEENFLGFNNGRLMSMSFIKSSRWFLCER